MANGHSEKPCQTRSPDDLADIGRQLRLSVTAVERLGALIESIDGEIRQDAQVPLLDRQRARRTRLVALKSVSSSVGKAVAALEGSASDLVLDRLLYRGVGSLLSTSALLELGDISVDSEFGFRDQQCRDFRARGGPAPAIEAAMRSRRQLAAQGRAAELLAALLRRMRQCVDDELEAERENRGGSPGNMYRRHAIQRLAAEFEELTGKEPTSTPAGDFVLLCELVLTSIGLDTTGLESSVSRELRLLRTLGR